MAQSKATKKFEKNRLKDTLERRKGLKKIKQKQQLKARKKARRAEENGTDVNEQKEEQRPRRSSRPSPNDALKDMTVDEFFAGGFDIPELPQKKGSKRKRAKESEEEDGTESDQSFEQEPVPTEGDLGTDSEDDPEDFKHQLDALAQKDPEFHQMLQRDEPEVFQDLDALELSEDEEEQPKRKKQRKDEDSDKEAMGENELDMETVKKWQTNLVEQHSLRAAKEIVIAFRSAAQISSSESEEKEFKYSVSDPDVYHQLLTTALKQIPEVFQHHLPVQENKLGRVHVATESKKFKTIAPLLRSQISGILHLIDHLSDPATLRLTLTSLLPLLPYLLSFKKLVRDTSRAVAGVWSASSNTESTRIAAFLVMRRLVVIGDAGIREGMLKAAYQALVQGSRNTTVHTIAGINLMKNSAAELWGLAGGEGGVAYTTAFTFIRSLAMHLRKSITNNSNESYKQVYNWQYVHGLDFWSRVVANHCTESTSPLRPLIYPLVQVTLGALRLIPTATYFPLRFHLVRALLRISRATGTYIPLAAPLHEVLTSAELRKPPRPSTLAPLDFVVALRAPKSYLRTRAYQDGVADQLLALLGEFFLLWARSIAFPELALPVSVLLRRWLKEANSRTAGAGNRNQKANAALLIFVQKLDAHAAWIAVRRARVEFAPSDRAAVEQFLHDVPVETTPLGAYVLAQQKAREEKQRMLEEGRKEEERRRRSEREVEQRGNEASESEDASDDDEEEEEEEEEEIDDMDESESE